MALRCNEPDPRRGNVLELGGLITRFIDGHDLTRRVGIERISRYRSTFLLLRRIGTRRLHFCVLAHVHLPVMKSAESSMFVDRLVKYDLISQSQQPSICRVSW